MMQQYIIGNWKMNGTKTDAEKLATGCLKYIEAATRPLPHVVLCPSYPYLMSAVEILKDSPIEVGAQDCNPEISGPFTGDISPTQLIDVGCKYVIVGHSERRQYHHENSLLIRKKLEAAVKAGLRPIFCLGESASDRKAGQALQVISNQLSSDLPPEIPHTLLIAYEPIWAIGTGLTPTLGEIEEVMGFLKHELSIRTTGGAIIPTLYGGSVTALNAFDFLNLAHVNGLLVGGASLKLDEFWKIISASQQ